MSKELYDYDKELKDVNKFYKSLGASEEIFKSQMESIDKISGSQWYKNIKNFFIIQLNDGMNILMNTSADNQLELARLQWKIQLSKKFLDYLDSREK